MRYRIDPAGVQADLAVARADAEQLPNGRQPLGSCLESAASGCGGSGVVAAALAAFGAGEHDRIERMTIRAGACVDGAVEAVSAYVRADQQMAAETTVDAGRATERRQHRSFGAGSW